METALAGRPADSAHPPLTIAGLRVRAVEVPMAPPVETAAGAVRTAPLVLVDLQTREGVVGRAYVFTYAKAALGPTASLIVNLSDALLGHVVAPASLYRALHAHFRLLGHQGLAGLAISAIDMAAWDAFAQGAGVPLCCALGASGAEPIRAYASLRGATALQIASEATAARRAGYTAAKVKFSPESAEDEILAAVRDAMGEHADIMVDYNQSLTVPQAISRAARLERHDLVWIEEPVRADDYEGHAAVAAATRTAIQVGENYWGPHEAARSLRAQASDCLMPDLMKIGGVTGWMQTAALAEAAGTPVSSHLFVEFSSHVLAATPGRHFLEWMDLARPILESGAPQVNRGIVVPTSEPGAGLRWNEVAVRNYGA